MHTEENWIVASRMVRVLTKEDRKNLVDLGAQFGGGWMEVHRYVNVNPANRQQIVKYLKEKGYTICSPDDEKFARFHDHDKSLHHDHLELKM